MPAFLLVYFPGSRTSSVIGEKDIQSGKIDVNEEVTVLYEDGTSYKAKIMYISTKRDCTEKQKLVQPDGTFLLNAVPLTLVSPSPGTTAIVKNAFQSTSQTPSQAQTSSIISSNEGKAIMKVLQRIENRMDNMERDIAEIKRNTNEGIVSIREVHNSVTALSSDLESAKADAAEVKATVRTMNAEVAAIVSNMPRQKLLDRLDFSLLSSEELSYIARIKNTATSFALEVESRLYANDPENDVMLPIQQRYKTVQKTNYLKASLKQFLDIRGGEYTDATVQSVWSECIRAINARVRFRQKQQESSQHTNSTTAYNIGTPQVGDVQFRNQPVYKQLTAPLSPPHRRMLNKQVASARKYVPGPAPWLRDPKNLVADEVTTKREPLSRVTNPSINRPSTSADHDDAMEFY